MHSSTTPLKQVLYDLIVTNNLRGTPAVQNFLDTMIGTISNGEEVPEQFPIN